MWSRKPMPVEISEVPVPSSATRPLIRVSLVLRSTVATRTAVLPTGPIPRLPQPGGGGALLTRTAQTRHCADIIAGEGEGPVHAHVSVGAIRRPNLRLLGAKTVT